jgi:hypothetical protein
MCKETPKDDRRQRRTGEGSHKQTDQPGKAIQEKSKSRATPKSILKSSKSPTHTLIQLVAQFLSAKRGRRR